MTLQLLGWLPAVMALWAPGPLHPGPRADSVLVLRGGRYLDVRSGTLRPNGAIVVRGGRIVAIHAAASGWQAPAGARVLELEGRTLLPGLVDAHVHLSLGGDPEANAAATLRAGFTTVVDLGSAGGAAIRLRDAIAGGRMPGPRVISAGSWIGARGGVCEFGGATVGSAEEAGARARADLDAGADLLKVCVTGWVAEAVAFPDSVQLGNPSIVAVREAASAAGRPVYAHAIGQAGALLAAALGVRALAHTPIVDSAAAERLKDSGVHVISTLATLAGGPAGEQVGRSLRLLHRAGVPIVLGTDAGVLPHGSNAKELVALTEAGLSPIEAIRAATIDAAALLGMSGIGEIVTGAPGDLAVVVGDPLRDLRVLAEPLLVVKAGRVAWEAAR